MLTWALSRTLALCIKKASCLEGRAFTGAGVANPRQPAELSAGQRGRFKDPLGTTPGHHARPSLYAC